MTRLLSSTLMMGLLTLGTAAIADEAQPQQTAPAAACPVPHDDAATEPGQMPQGHPQLPQGHPQLPTGHPPMGGMAGMGAGPSAGASTSGSIVVKVVQGTPDAPAVINEPVTVELYNQGELAQTIETALDQHGVVILDGFDLAASLQPVITMEHAGVTYTVTGKPMTAMQPDQVLRLVAYESTDEVPAWTIKMRHVILQPTAQGLMVNEMLAINNPATRTWTGAAAEGAADPCDAEHAEGDACSMDTHDRATVVLPLPDGATDLHLTKGFDECCAKTEGGKIVSTRPLLPGVTEVHYTYTMPVVDGQAAVRIAAPATVGRLIVFVADDGTTVTAEGIAGGESMTMGERKVRLYQAAEVPAGTNITLTVEGIAAQDPVAEQEPVALQSSATPKVVAGIGAGALLLIGGVVLVMSPRKSHSQGKAN